MGETLIETQPIDRWAVVSLGAAVLTLTAVCAGVVPVPLTGFVCFPAAAGFGVVAFVSGLTSLRRVRTSGEAGRAFAWIGTAVGGLAIASLICLLVLAFLLYPSFIDLLHRLRLQSRPRAPYLPIPWPSIMLARGSGQVPAGFLVFKTCGGSRCGPRWVRLPSTPAPARP